MAENVQELVIRYRADVEELQSKVAQIEAELRKVPQAATQAGTATTQAFKTTGTEAKKASTNVGDFSAKVKASVTNIKPISDQFASLGKSIVAAFAVERIIQFGFESVKAFQEAEKNAVKLQSAVSVNGGLQHDFDELIKQSQELQETTIFSDDAVQNAQTAALQFGLTREQVQKLIPVVADFASATGQDLQSALNGILQGVNGSERALKKYGVVVEEGGTRTSRLAGITDQLTKKFEGQAEVIGNTAFGAAEKYNNQLDEMQENLGERLSPILQNVRGFFLAVADGTVFAMEKLIEFNPILNAMFGTAEKGIAELSALAAQLNLTAVNDSKKIFATLSDANIQAKIDVLTSSLAEARKEAQGKNAIDAQAANDRIAEYANQITALRIIQNERKQGISSLNEEATALEKLKNIATLSDSELKKIATTLSKFNSIESQDALDLISKELEARQKGTAKAIEDRKKGLDTLAKLELDASDKLLQIKAAEVDAVAKLEQDKQTRLRDLVAAAGTASGADVAPIELEFRQTGRVDIERTLNLLRNAQFPEAELQKFIQAVNDTSAAFDVLISKEQEASKEVQLKINKENIENDFADLRAQFETFQQREEIQIQVAFLQAGDFTPEAIAKFDADIKASREKTFASLVEQAKKMGVDMTAINAEVLQKAKDANQDEIDANKEKTAAILAQEQEIAQKRKDLLREIRDTAIDFAASIIENAIDSQADSAIKAAERGRDSVIAAKDEEIQKIEEANDKGIIGDRKAEESTKQLKAEQAKAESEAASRIAKIKRKQFQQDQIASVGKIAIAAQVAAAESGFNPILTALYEALALLQIGIVLSKPNPYAKGTKNAKPGLSIVGEEGPEFVMMPAGGKVVTAEKTKRHAKVIDAMMDDNLESHIEKTFVEPALKEERKRVTQRSTAEFRKAMSELSSENTTENNFTKSTHDSRTTSKDEQRITDKSKVNVKNEINSTNENTKNETSKQAQKVTAESISERKVVKEKQYSSIIEAMYEGKVDEYLKQSEAIAQTGKQDVVFDSVINHRELNKILTGLQVSPILKQAEKKHEEQKRTDFATNIANSFKMQGMTAQEYSQRADENRRKGTYIRNAHEITAPLLEVLKDFRKPSFKDL